ncbi:ABC transporter ATPase [Namhaeicola litoreus]|uniref:ABC transporter ATPase n=1 Tax=Namhaeicola litoreus TaxID=1052145 RepID=A0ABW3XZU0_9FLAO
MLVDIEGLEEDARVLIFPGDRKFYPEETEEVDKIMTALLAELPIRSFYKLFFDRFIVVILSSDQTFDISMNDQLIEVIQNFERKYNISLIDKVKVFFKQGEFIQSKEVPDFKKLIKNKSVSRGTMVFNHFVHTKREFEEAWETPAEESWISHFF